MSDFPDFESDKWTANIHLGTGIFTLDDALGMQEIAMDPFGFAHLADSGPGGLLMEPFLTNGERKLISEQEARMLAQAYGYNLDLPEPGALLLLAVASILLLLIRENRNEQRAYA